MWSFGEKSRTRLCLLTFSSLHRREEGWKEQEETGQGAQVEAVWAMPRCPDPMHRHTCTQDKVGLEPWSCCNSGRQDVDVSFQWWHLA